MRSGSAADTQAVSDYVRYFLDMHKNETQKPTNVKTAAKLVSKLLYENKGMLMGEMIVAGWDKQSGGQVYKCAMGGSLLRRPYSTGGSGSIFIAAHCENNFRPGMTREQAMEFVDKGARRARRRSQQRRSARGRACARRRWPPLRSPLGAPWAVPSRAPPPAAAQRSCLRWRAMARQAGRCARW